MNEKLAELYGTQVTDEADTEKLAAAALAEGLAGEGGLDLDTLTPEQLEALASEVLTENSGEEKTAAEEGAEEAVEEQTEETATEEEATEEETEEKEPEVEAAAEETEEAAVEEPSEEVKEKVAEADYLGRVMAHAYVQELKEIEKTAGAKDAAKGVGMAAAFTAGKLHGKAKKAVKSVSEHVGKHKKKYVAGAAGAAAAGGAAAAYKHKKKHASATPALDTLVDQRVSEILAANGVDTSGEQEKVASEEQDPAQALAFAVEERAVAKLQEMGYTFEEETTEEK